MRKYRQDSLELDATVYLMGGEHSELEFELSEKHAMKNYAQLTFAAERWTKRAPFSYRVRQESETSGRKFTTAARQ